MPASVTCFDVATRYNVRVRTTWTPKINILARFALKLLKNSRALSHLWTRICISTRRRFESFLFDSSDSFFLLCRPYFSPCVLPCHLPNWHNLYFNPSRRLLIRFYFCFSYNYLSERLKSSAPISWFL